MREHEVPTHVQAEDKVLLWFTFPQIVAVVAVCAVAYGAFHYLPFGPVAVRLGVGVLIGVVGIALTVGKVGGRGLPLVAADLLKFNLGARRYAGSPAQLVISEPPAPPEAKPDPLRLLVKKAASGLSRAVKAARRKGRPPFRPHSWFGKRRRPKDGGGNKAVNGNQQKKPWHPFLAVAALGVLAVVLLPATALADDPDDEGWRLDEIYFVPPDPVPGRRIFIERVAVSGDTANVTLRAAHDLDLQGRAYGGREGRTLRMGVNSSFRAGEAKSYNLTLNGPKPSFTLSWRDALGRSGAVSLKSHQLPYPLPKAGGGLCDLEVTSLEWTPGSISGVIVSECITETRQEVEIAGVRRPLQSDGARPAGRRRHPHRRQGQRGGRKPPRHGVLHTGRRDPLHPSGGEPQGDPQAGNHGGTDGDFECPAAAHVADHPPPGPDRRVHPKGDLPLR